MGVFDFLKKFSKKEEGGVELKLDEISDWGDSHFKKNIENVETKLTGIRKNIENEKKKVDANLKELKEAKLRNKNVPERVVQIINGNRETYIQKVGLLMSEVIVPKEFDEIIEFCEDFENVINTFSKSTMKAYQVLQEFFGDKSFSVAESIRDTDKLVKGARTVLKNADIDKLEELKQKVGAVLKKINSKGELKEEVRLAKNELCEKNKKLVDLEKELEDIKKGGDYRLFNELVDKKEKLSKKKKELEMRLWHSFSVIEAGLKKYERVTLEKETVRKYLANSLMALLKDTELKIADILSKMGGAISGGEVELKDKKKEKILHELEGLGADYFKSFLEEYNKLKWELDQLRVKFEESTVIKNVEKLNVAIEGDKTKIGSIKIKIKNSSEEINTIDIDKLKKKLEKEIKETTNKIIVVS